METVAIRQQLLSQYDTLQSRIKDLKDAAENEVNHHFTLSVLEECLFDKCYDVRYGCWLVCVNWRTKLWLLESLLTGNKLFSVIVIA